MSEVTLFVNGGEFKGWEAVRVMTSIESLVGEFDITANDKWGGQDQPWPIAEEDTCRVEIDGQAVLDGFVDRRSIQLSKDSRSISFSGRDRTGVLDDSSALLDQWTFKQKTVADIAAKVCEPFGILVTVQDGLKLTKQRKVVVNPGDTAFEVIARAAASSGVLLVSDGAGGLLITRASGERTDDDLVEGKNILAAAVDYEAAERASRYVVMTQVGGSDEASGGATRIRAEARDEEVRRADRVLVIRPEVGTTTDYARQRADWEARIRAARSEQVTIMVQGWKQASGRLWPVNALVAVRSPGIGVNGDMRISEREFKKDNGGEVTQLRLVRPDAFTPEPQAVVRRSSGGLWKELAGGAR